MATASTSLRLATEIAAQFRHIPQDQAAHTIAKHIHSFWDPRMRAQLKVQVAQAGANCDPLVAAATGLIDSEPAEIMGE
ncbi:formate dehydrogenase subunit delta [Mycobacterium aquaticum]|uniref:Formate dehydrogenase n=1 Tax=Mycobacterium aquaticum TaxID=1927124 RepID=A0A1X0AAQ1_9MYCO|nr:formate dehydrogenase subunit delta [Mycobacterium aquaticum]ORA26938.1 hypothetical protein BST13_31460 [Mycobacterium aquaticum]